MPSQFQHHVRINVKPHVPADILQKKAPVTFGNEVGWNPGIDLDAVTNRIVFPY